MMLPGRLAGRLFRRRRRRCRPRPPARCPSRPIVTTCGSGVTAAIIALALETMGRPARSLYDGSWSEWGADPTRPVATGA